MELNKALRWMAEQGSQLTLTRRKRASSFCLQLDVMDGHGSVLRSEQFASVRACNTTDELPLVKAVDTLIAMTQRKLVERSDDAERDQADAEAAT